MGFVYILQSQKTGKYYIGSTNDLYRRLSEHTSGKTKSLRFQLPLELVFNQKYNSLREAREIEAWLKKAKNRNIIQRIIREGYIQKGP